MTKRLPLIGLSGTNGSGKDTVGHLLAEQHNFWFFSFTELFREECRQRGIPVTRENTRMVSAQWRRESGFATLIDRSMAKFQEQAGTHDGIVLSSIRNPYEADRIHELGGTLIWIDADPKIRYERIQANAASRGRTGEDDRTFEQFLADEQAEMHPPTGADEAALNMTSVKAKSDLFLSNNGSDLDEFARYITGELTKHGLIPRRAN